MAAPQFALVEIDLIKVKGKTEPERIFALAGDTAMASTPEFAAFLEKQEAFLVAHTSFQTAARNVVTEMLKEIDPAAIEASLKPGFKFGPLRKAELFELYHDKHEVLTKWVAAGHFNEKLLREFEKLCQRSYHPSAF